MNKKSQLQRDKNPMTPTVRKALEDNGLMDDFHARPAYQQNDYLGWIQEAKQEQTQEKRLRQMLDELRKGGVYMKMEHRPSRKG